MLNVKAFGLTAGIFWAISVAWCFIVGLSGAGTAPYELVNQLYLGFFSLSTNGLVLGTFIAFIDGLIAGLFFAWLYNRLSR